MEYSDHAGCCVPDCNRGTTSRGLCNKHYQRYREMSHLISVAMFADLGGPTWKEFEAMDDDGNLQEKHCPSCTCAPVVQGEEEPWDDDLSILLTDNNR